MADRPVTHSRKDQYGNITALGNPNGAWSVRSSSLIISDIQARAHTYYVPWQSGRTEISVVHGSYGPYLRTDRDNTSRNNLDDLPGI
ncbi:DUF3892 domain-containing protein [Arthrobacter sp. UYCu723]